MEMRLVKEMEEKKRRCNSKNNTYKFKHHNGM